MLIHKPQKPAPPCSAVVGRLTGAGRSEVRFAVRLPRTARKADCPTVRRTGARRDEGDAARVLELVPQLVAPRRGLPARSPRGRSPMSSRTRSRPRTTGPTCWSAAARSWRRGGGTFRELEAATCAPRAVSGRSGGCSGHLRAVGSPRIDERRSLRGTGKGENRGCGRVPRSHQGVRIARRPRRLRGRRQRGRGACPRRAGVRRPGRALGCVSRRPPGWLSHC